MALTVLRRSFVVRRKRPPDPVPFPSTLTPHAQAWTSLHAIADDALPALQGLVLETMEQAQAIIPADVLTALATPGTEAAATAQLTSAWDLAVGNTLAPRVATQLRRVFLQAAQQSAQTFTTRAEIDIIESNTYYDQRVTAARAGQFLASAVE